MNNLVTTIINWSEVWSLLIPLIIILLYRPKGNGTKPLVVYVCIAFVLNSIATVMVEYYFSMPEWLKNNNILYNLHSLVRVLCFSWYIITIRQYRFPNILKWLLVVYSVFVIVDFVFFESIFRLSTSLFAAESIVLLILCFSLFFRLMQDESGTNWLKHPSFLVCTGISLYEVTSFFIFLFFYPLYDKNPAFGDLTLSIHNIMYCILCFILAIVLYRSRKRVSNT